MAQLQSLWQVVCLSNLTLSCSKTAIHQSCCMWCTRNLKFQSSLAQGHESQAYSLSLLLPPAAVAHHRALAKHQACCMAAAEGAASHQGDQFLLQVHRIPAPGKEGSTGGTSRSSSTTATQPNSQCNPGAQKMATNSTSLRNGG